MGEPAQHQEGTHQDAHWRRQQNDTHKHQGHQDEKIWHHCQHHTVVDGPRNLLTTFPISWGRPEVGKLGTDTILWKAVEGNRETVAQVKEAKVGTHHNMKQGPVLVAGWGTPMNFLTFWSHHPTPSQKMKFFLQSPARFLWNQKHDQKLKATTHEGSQHGVEAEVRQLVQEGLQKRNVESFLVVARPTDVGVGGIVHPTEVEVGEVALPADWVKKDDCY